MPSTAKEYVMPILTAIMAPALIAMFTAGWHFAGKVGDNSRDLAEAKREFTRVYSEGTAALKAHLQDERYSDAKFEEVQSDVAEMRNDVKDMRAEQQQQSLLMRELLTEIKMRSPTRPDTP